MVILSLLLGVNHLPSSAAATIQKAESFDHDPGWEGFNNHITNRVPTVMQDFGYCDSNHAGKEKGEIGGRIWRSSTRASYADHIPTKTLAARLSASGTFAITDTMGSSGAFFGWFNVDRTVGVRSDSLGFRFSGQGSGARMTLQLVTDKNQACGTKITPWSVDKSKAKGEGRKYRPTSIKNDGTRYTWTLDYDPAANDGNGQISFTIKSCDSKHEEFENKPITVDLPAGYKAQGTEFNRFGLMNGEKGGNSMTIYFDDLQYDGKSEDFSHDPGWQGSGNRTTFEDRVQGGAHDFGFLPDTMHAGGKPGEIGGVMWRSGRYGYYADRIGPLTFSSQLTASGKVILEAAPPDSGMYVGWFNSTDRENAPSQAGGFIGIKIGGPTRAGHYFAPAYATFGQTENNDEGQRPHAKRAGRERKGGPLLIPQKVYDWKLVYDPSGNGGAGMVVATLGRESITLPLKDGDKETKGIFDRFGLFTAHIGGSYVKIYFDDLTYTAASY